MLLNWLLTILHLLALAIALPSIWRRSRALQGAFDKEALQRAISADTVWGLAVGLWLLTGVARLFRAPGGPGAYLDNPIFLAKMVLFALLLLLEILPMFTFMRWRAVLANDRLPDPKSAPLIARLSQLQLLVIILTTIAALAFALQPNALATVLKPTF